MHVHNQGNLDILQS